MLEQIMKKYNVTGVPKRMTKQLLRENPYNSRYEFLQEFFGSDVALVDSSNVIIAIYRNSKCFNVDMPDCVEVIDPHTMLVIERIEER